MKTAAGNINVFIPIAIHINDNGICILTRPVQLKSRFFLWLEPAIFLLQVQNGRLAAATASVNVFEPIAIHIAFYQARTTKRQWAYQQWLPLEIIDSVYR